MNKNTILGIILGCLISFVFQASRVETKSLPLPSISCFSPSPVPEPTENLNDTL